VKIAVGSKNPVKIGAVSDAFKLTHPSFVRRITGYEVASDVPHNPVGEEQCIRGACNRARAAWRAASKPDFAVGIESGIYSVSLADNNVWFERTWVVVINKDAHEVVGSGAGFRVPDHVARRICAGQGGLGGITDAYTGLKGTKSGDGYCGLVTKQLLCRREVTRDAVIAALVELFVPEFFTNPQITVTAE